MFKRFSSSQLVLSDQFENDFFFEPNYQIFWLPNFWGKGFKKLLFSDYTQKILLVSISIIWPIWKWLFFEPDNQIFWLPNFWG